MINNREAEGILYRVSRLGLLYTGQEYETALKVIFKMTDRHKHSDIYTLIERYTESTLKELTNE